MTISAKTPGKNIPQEQDEAAVGNNISVWRYKIPMPVSRGRQIALGWALILGGVLGFLPVLGFWMIPLGILVLKSAEGAWVPALPRRWSVKLLRFWRRLRRKGPS